jgi:DNA invertase Pin-like site-specific DNA recombinase
MPNPRHIALYLRVSSDKQSDERQYDSVPKLAASDYADEQAVEYREQGGVSATSVPIFERPEGKRLCEAIAARQVAVVIADEQTRLVRGKSGAEWAMFFDLCREAGTRIHTVREGILDDGDTSEMVGMIRAFVARQEVAAMKHRVRGGLQAVARAGQYPYGNVPYGYERRPDKRLRRTEAAGHVAQAFEDVAAGMPKPQARAAFEKVRGQTVHPANFDRMLKNPAYVGCVTVDGETFQNVAPRLISDETFGKVQRILIGLSASRRREPTEWPFQHVAKCSSCGGNLRLQRVGSKGYRYAYVSCRNADNSAACCWQRIDASSFAANFATYLTALASNAADLLANDPNYAIPSGAGQTAEEARNALDAARQNARKLGGLIADGVMEQDDPRYLAALDARDAAHASLDRLSGKARDHRAELADFVAAVEALALNAEPWMVELVEEQLRDAPWMNTPTQAHRELVCWGWQLASFEQKRHIVTATLDRITVNEDGSAEWSFRRGLVHPLSLPALLSPGSARMDDHPGHLVDEAELDAFASTNPVLAPDVCREWNVLSTIHSRCLAPEE